MLCSINIAQYYSFNSRSQWPHSLRPPACAIMGFNPTRGMDVCLLSDRGLCDKLITHPEECYRLGPLCEIKKPRERGGHSPHWAAEPEKIIIIVLILCNRNNSVNNLWTLLWNVCLPPTCSNSNVLRYSTYIFQVFYSISSR
jgi:hypothetical protein